MKYFKQIILGLFFVCGIAELSAAASSVPVGLRLGSESFFNLKKFNRQFNQISSNSNKLELERFLFDSMVMAVNSDFPPAVLCVMKAFNSSFGCHGMLPVFSKYGINVFTYSRKRNKAYRKAHLSQFPDWDYVEFQKRKQGSFEIFMILTTHLSCVFISAVERLDVQAVSEFLTLGARPELKVWFGRKYISAVELLHKKSHQISVCGECSEDLVRVQAIHDLLSKSLGCALFVAIKNGNLDWVRRLLHAGASIYAQNEDGVMAYDFAKKLSEELHDSTAFRSIFGLIQSRTKKITVNFAKNDTYSTTVSDGQDEEDEFSGFKESVMVDAAFGSSDFYTGDLNNFISEIRCKFEESKGQQV